MKKHILLALIFGICHSSTADTYTVTNTLDDLTSGSLRWAIDQANTNPGADVIVFSSALIITIDESLTITTGNGDDTTIDGDFNGDGTPDITIQTTGNLSGLIIEGDNCIIRALHMRGFDDASRAAILVDGGAGTSITECRLGVTSGGNATDTPNHSGIMLDNGATGTTIGNGTLFGANVLGGNNYGIRIRNASDNTTISGNRIGIGLDGTTAVANSIGIHVFNTNATNIGVSGALPNLISSNTSQGIELNGGTTTTIINNYIGVDASGNVDKGNGIGIEVTEGSNNTQIGGDASSRNIISGSAGRGIDINNSNLVKVHGNYIGLGLDGNTIVANGTSGPANIDVRGNSFGTNIGDVDDIVPPNVISGGGGSGVRVEANGTHVVNNLIGTDATGLLDRGNSVAGISLQGGYGTIGGLGRGNIISGNSYGIGVSIGGFNILANYIGTDINGTAAIPNDNQGIRLGTGSGTSIGDGTVAGANLISGNTQEGILVFNPSVTGNTVHMNYIGVQADGVSALGNGTDGILIESQSTLNTFQENIIANNGGDGIELTDSGTDQNTITQNSIYSNAGEAILITNSAQNGITPPVISATYNGLISGTSDNDAVIEFFADGADESAQYLGTTTADAGGNWSHQVDVGSINEGLINISVTQTSNSRTSELISALLELPFITTWTAPANGELPIYKFTGAYNYNLVWSNLTSMGLGDGSTNGQTGNFTITGLTSGHTYQLEISGLFPWMMADLTGAEYLQTVEQWGTISWADMTNMFAHGVNLVVNATDAPDLTNVTSMDQMFWDCTNLTGEFNHWNVSNVESMLGTFQQATNFNEDLSGWDVTNVQNMSNLFDRSSFNGNISTWEVGNVSNMGTMFNNSPFNQDISGWEVGNVTNMSSMFGNNTVFNQDLSAWGNKLDMVSNMGSMFMNANAFNQSLAPWDISSVTYMTNMLSNSGLSETNYEATLVAWAALPSVQTDVELGATGLTYCAASSARDDLMSDGWTFSGDIENCPFLSYASGIDITSQLAAEYPVFSLFDFERDPQDIAFNNDGTKLFIVGTHGDEINQFNLDTPYETTTGATYDGVFNVFSYAPTCLGFAFNTEGTKLYLIGSTGTITQLSLNTPFDITDTPTLDGNEDVSTDGTDTRDVAFNADGSLLYVASFGDSEINQYGLTTSFDITDGLNHQGSLDVSNENDFPEGLAFNLDGSKLFIVGRNTDAIYQYDVASPFDLTAGVTYEGMTEVNFQENDPSGLAFDATGSKAFIVGTAGKEINQFSIGPAFKEAVANDGSVFGSILIQIKGDTFTNAGTTLTYNTDYSISNNLEGLTPLLNISADGTLATFTLTGNATDHLDINNIADLEFTFENSAFSGNDASTINNSLNVNTGMNVRFFQTEYPVINTLDEGAGSLRWALNSSQTAYNDVTITFDLSGDGSGTSWTFNPLTPLPILENNHDYLVVLDGTTQTGWDRATDRMIVIQDASDIDYGLEVNSFEGIEIYGLKIRGFDIGIYATYLENATIGASGKSNVISGNETGVYSEYPHNNTISYNYIGTDVTGSSADPNGIGLDFGYTYSESYDNYFTHNVISGNTQIGLAISYSDNFVQNNKIGVSEDESSAIPNGIGVWVGSSGFIEDNVIAGNTETGIWMQTTRNGNEIHIRRNYIGRNTAGTSLPNGNGILSENDDGDPPSFGDAPIIGGDATEGNYIAYNFGVAVELDGNAYMETKITNNSIYENGSGIELLNGADGGIAPPIITDVSASAISGTVADNTTGTIHIYEVDPISGNQGKLVVDSEVVNDFTWSVSSPPTFDPAKTYTATVTTDEYGTSEFSVGPKIYNATQVTTSSFVANWSPFAGASNIFVDVDDDMDFSSPIVSDQSISTGGTASVSASLTEGTQYYYRLQADLGTALTPMSDHTSFMVAAGHALAFNGIDNVVDFGNIHNEVIAGNDKKFTIEAWINLTAIGSLGEVIFSKQGNSNCGSDERQMSFSIREDGLLRFGYHGDLSLTSQRTIGGSTVLKLNEWYHVSASYDGALDSNDGLDRVKLYVNGKEEATSLFTAIGALPSQIQEGPARMAAGGGLNSVGTICAGADQLFSGSMDEIRLWDAVRSQAEVQANMRSSLVGNEANLVAYYRFDQGIAEGDNTTPPIDLLPDGSQNINHGALNNFTLNGTSSNWVDAEDRYIPFAPTNLRVVEVSLTQIDLTWDDNSSNETGFRIERAESPDYDFVGDNLIETTGANGTATASHSNTYALFSEGNYLYKVQAENSFGRSAWSNFKTGNTVTHPGNALNFDGNGEEVNLGNPDFSEVNALTVETWINPSHIPEYDEGGETATIIGKGSTGGTGTTTFALVMEADETDKQELFALVDNGSTIQVARFDDGNGFDLTENEWRHIALTWASGSPVRLYVDGIERDATSNLSGPIHIVADDLLLGTSSDVQEIDYTGAIDEVRIWTVQRSAADIQNNRFNPLVGNEAGLMAYYRFDQGDAGEDNTTPMVNLLPDRSQNQNDGMLNGFLLDGVNSNWITSEISIEPEPEPDAYTVTNTLDDGIGSLRWAIENANVDPDLNTISFNIPNSDPNYDIDDVVFDEVWTISPATDLPPITEAAFLNADTQPGDGDYRIKIDGQGIVDFGLQAAALGVEIAGFHVINFDLTNDSYGIGMDMNIAAGPHIHGNLVNNCRNGIYISRADGSIIRNNITGMDEHGAEAPNDWGIRVESNAQSTIIGGLDANEGNLVAWSNQSGIQVSESDNSQVLGNKIGTDATGTQARPNRTGLDISDSYNVNVQNNVISGNEINGISLYDSEGLTLFGNIIGMDATTTNALPNNNDGISSSSLATNMTIGGLGVENTIAHNTNNGISLDKLSDIGTDILQNAIFCNGKGIDLNGQGNNNQQPPVIASVTSTVVSGTAGFFETIHVYRDNECTPAQGKEYLGMASTSDASSWSLSGLVIDTDNDIITATATSGINGTSEFTVYEKVVVDDLTNGVKTSNYDALVALYEATDGENWTAASNWLSEEDVIDWFGVTVENEVVTALDLSENGLVGVLPDDVLDLTELISLKVNGNQLTGLPDLSSLSQLEELNLASNQFDFADIIDNITIASFTYAPQANLDGLDHMDLAQCDNLDVSLPSNGSADSFQWFKDNNELTEQTNSSLVINDLTPEDAGTYYLEVTHSLIPNLTLTSASFDIQVEAFVPTITQVGKVFTLIELEASEGDSYQWMENGSPIAGETDQTFFVKMEISESPSYTVAVTIGDCTSTSDAYLIAILSTNSIESGIKVFPNPIKENLTIRMNESINQLKSLKIYNITGVEVYSAIDIRFDQKDQTFDVSHLPLGIYFISIDEQVFRIAKQ